LSGNRKYIYGYEQSVIYFDEEYDKPFYNCRVIDIDLYDDELPYLITTQNGENYWSSEGNLFPMNNILANLLEVLD